jgi:aspartate racemase
MNTIGLVGGMSWESSIAYERLISQEVRRRLGGNHSADLLIRSSDFTQIQALQQPAMRRLPARGWRLAPSGSAYLLRDARQTGRCRTPTSAACQRRLRLWPATSRAFA